jgi:hypothetical protein
MKTSLTLIRQAAFAVVFLLAATLCHSQKSIKDFKIDTTTAALANGKYLLYSLIDTIYQYHKIDTFRVIMLVCDTSFHQNFNQFHDINNQLIVETYNQRNNVVFYKFGYEKRIHKGFATYSEYLDEFKQPLDKSIYVWMVYGISSR